MYLFGAIPNIVFPQSVTKGKLSAEPIVPLDNSFAIMYQPKYYLAGVGGATDVCYLRQSVWQLLVKVKTLLPNSYNLLIYDGWRPLVVQQSLYDSYKAELLRQNPTISNRQLKTQLLQFVATPTQNVRKAPLHCTGGAVDLTLADKYGVPLDMGTDFDHFGVSANTAFFEQSYQTFCQKYSALANIYDKQRFDVVRNNRRILYNAMTTVGFSNLPTEWWHYDYGDRFWAYYKGEEQRFGGAFSVN